MMEEEKRLYKLLRIKAVLKERDDFSTIVFEDSQLIAPKAGQYLTLVKSIAGEEVRRSYSLVSAPALHEPPAIGVKRIENGLFSRDLLAHAKPGTDLLTTGNGGFFVLPENMQPYGQLFFFAAGSGITPVLSLVKTALHLYLHTSVVLIYSNASAEKAVYLSVLQQLAKEFPERFTLELLFSNTVNLARARLHRDLILLFLRQYMLLPPRATLFYICGPESYMRLCTFTLQEAGIPPANIRKENFFFHGTAQRNATPPDKGCYPVIIRIGTQQYTVKVRYPHSILKAAKQVGLHLPYSCEAGRCGSCVAVCVKGKVWHSYNEVLTEKELAEGLVLTCVGHPVGGAVELNIV